MAVGVVQIEISIEEDILKKLLWIREHAGALNYQALTLHLESVFEELLRLKKLEAREPGIGKYEEVKDINAAIVHIRQTIKLSGVDLTHDIRTAANLAYGSDWPTIKGKIDELYAIVRRLVSMELRLG